MMASRIPFGTKWLERSLRRCSCGQEDYQRGAGETMEGSEEKDGVEKLRSWSRQVFRAGWPGSAEECFGLYLLRNHKQSSEAKFGQRQKNLDINADQSTSCRQKWRLLLYKS
ncbi:unnamed protein product [Durusdinium trenchii]|uniref:Uncharacterized protein n=1 Tax=Durusdinium trenchii TaxID=1381693 RepID=A0ABP0JNS1_9DINO